MSSMLFPPQDTVFWYTLRNKPQRLKKPHAVDVVVIGGGMAGLTAAQAFHERGLSVMLLEQYFCGGGASGKSSGFITPDSEIELHQFVERYGPERATQLWNFAISGVDQIRNNIKKYALECDYEEQDSVTVANSPEGFAHITKEHEARRMLGYQSILYDAKESSAVVNSPHYYGARRYGHTFGIHAYRYCIGMRDVLIDQGVEIYEETPVTKILARSVETPAGTISAKHIIVCADRFIPSLNKLTDTIYHAQTTLCMSAPLTDEQVRHLFPSGPAMVWDTALIYNYYRLTGDRRLMLGGSTLPGLYARRENHTFDGKIQYAYLKEKFPWLDIRFEYGWPGLIGISKDILPIAGPDREAPALYYVAAAAGLPWAAACAQYSTRHILDGDNSFAEYFSPYRPVPLGGVAQRILGDPLTFAWCNYISWS